ncbi:2-dehydro-3-deoxygluconokinase [Cytobacillus oceanisediminis]|uniref:2-dehydro-3-deoxygluconokinase n=1 Tax=Cytobacillus oceanisediminis TaxID=665099 RepID=A0A2V2ZLJ1_9BACI|nr:sugar kinase [Cytobacillus oceanisediminis]PWW20544.1 2-dehydro-3-deoxygluconokinase [Cytobacillus oceanisediminis]
MSSPFKVLTIGDAMITLNPAVKGPLRYVTQFERKVGGAELNFAIGCARLGLGSKWISRLGEDEFGRVIYNFTRGEGVDVSGVEFVNGCPTSLNFKEINEDGSGKTYYYRYNSPILTMAPDMIHERLLEEVDLVHLTGVFLAIDPKNIEITKKIIEVAKRKNIPISFDPNIRLKLWSIEEARKAYNSIFPHVDILLTGLDEIRLISGMEAEDELAMFAREYGIKDLVIKDGANGSKLFRDGKWTRAESFLVTPIDTVGAGDGFDAGYVYGWLNGFSKERLLKFANGVGALVTTVSGDNEGLPYLNEVNAFIDDELIIER